MREDNRMVVIFVKGMSVPWIAGGEGLTKRRDKLNNNLPFSCCCMRVGPMWFAVCNCYLGGDKCDQNCLKSSLMGNSAYYQIGMVCPVVFNLQRMSFLQVCQSLYNDVAYMYPDTNIWLTGA